MPAKILGTQMNADETQMNAERQRLIKASSPRRNGG
jgi:hypothetical protein